MSKTVDMYELLHKDIYMSNDKLTEYQGQALFDL